MNLVNPQSWMVSLLVSTSPSAPLAFSGSSLTWDTAKSHSKETQVVHLPGRFTAWWFIPRLVSGLVHPSYFSGLTLQKSHKWINPTYPIYKWGYNPLTSRGMNHQVVPCWATNPMHPGNFHGRRNQLLNLARASTKITGRKSGSTDSRCCTHARPVGINIPMIFPT